MSILAVDSKKPSDIITVIMIILIILVIIITITIWHCKN